MEKKMVMVTTQREIPLGYQGENDAVQVVFVVEPLGENWTLLHQRPADTAPYPVPLDVTSQGLIWHVTSGDTAYNGIGRAQLICSGPEGEILKTCTYRTKIAPSLPLSGEVPDPVKPWYDSIMEAIADAGGATPEDIRAAVDAYMEEHPMEESDPTVPQWAKSTSKPTYTASEVGALSADALPGAIDQALEQARQSGELTGISLGITGATVGQLAQIAAVDESGRPTAWEAVDKPSGGGGTDDGGEKPAESFPVTWALVNVTSTSNVSSVSAGAALVAVLTADMGYTLGEVTVTMGGSVLSGVWNADSSTLTIPAVTGAVVISCAGVEQTGPIDTTAVIAQENYSISSAGETTAKAGYGITKVYEFTYDVDALKQSKKYDSENDYLTGPAMGGFVVSIPNTNFVSGGGDTSNSASYGRHRYTADGAFIDISSNPASGGKISFPMRSSAILNANVVGVAFSIPLADLDDAYAYWCSPNPAACPTVFPNGYREGDIVFAGKNTEYYGLANIDGTLAGEEAATALSVDDDIAQDYSIATTSLLGKETLTDTSTAYGISSSLAAVIDEVRTAWMTEYGGDYRKIPIIVSTDQHGRRNSGIFNMLGKTLSMHDVSKIMNLGDTVATNWSDADTEHPLLTDSTLEGWCESVKEIPFSKQLNVFGNHDTWYGNYADEGNPIGTRYPSSQAHLYQYFRNIYARRTNNNGWFAVKDDQFNVKYVVISGFEYQGGGTCRISTAQMTWLISQLSESDGYDIVLVSHIPLHFVTSEMHYPTGDESSGSEDYRVSDVETDELFSARKDRDSGTVTDSDGVTHDYDFSGCTTELLCALHGHTHYDAYNYVGSVGVLSMAFDWFDDNTFFFALIDRVNNQLNIWKVEGDALTWQNYQIPMDATTK